PQVGYLNQAVRPDYDPAAKDPFKDAVLEGLKALGYVEGKNIHVDFRVPRKPQEIDEIARDLVEHKAEWAFQHTRARCLSKLSSVAPLSRAKLPKSILAREGMCQTSSLVDS